MSDYISREYAVDELQVKVFHNLTDEYYGTMQVLNELPAADVAPVRHGKWISDVFCSECGWVNEVEPGFIGDTKGFNFCPNCGAKMDKE